MSFPHEICCIICDPSSGRVLALRKKSCSANRFLLYHFMNTLITFEPHGNMNQYSQFKIVCLFFLFYVQLFIFWRLILWDILTFYTLIQGHNNRSLFNNFIYYNNRRELLQVLVLAFSFSIVCDCIGHITKLKKKIPSTSRDLR